MSALNALNNLIADHGEPAPDAQHYPAGGRRRVRRDVARAPYRGRHPQCRQPRQAWTRIHDGLADAGAVAEWNGLISGQFAPMNLSPSNLASQRVFSRLSPVPPLKGGGTGRDGPGTPCTASHGTRIGTGQDIGKETHKGVRALVRKSEGMGREDRPRTSGAESRSMERLKNCGTQRRRGTRGVGAGTRISRKARLTATASADVIASPAAMGMNQQRTER